MRGGIGFVLLLTCVAGCNRTGVGEPIYIGHLAPLQSTDKARFEHTRQGMSLAIEELNKQRGPGQRKLVVLHVHADEDLEQLQASAVRLLTVNRAAALIGGEGAAQVEKLTRAAQPYDTPLITPIMTGASLATETLYSLEPSPARAAKGIARWLAETIKKDGLALVADSKSMIATDLGTALRAEFEKTGGKTLTEVQLGTNPKAAEAAESIRRSKAGAWLYVGKPADWLAVRQALRAAKLNLPCLVLDGAGPLDAAEFDAEAPQYQLTTFFAGGEDKAASEFQAAYAKRFHTDPDLFAAQGYDAVKLVGDALANGKAGGGGRLLVDLAAFGKKPFSSCTGPLTFDPPSHSASRVLFLIQKTEKKPVLVFKAEPGERE
jgi:branched-chain amino acid transport system substrate-binding protein